MAQAELRLALRRWNGRPREHAKAAPVVLRDLPPASREPRMRHHRLCEGGFRAARVACMLRTWTECRVCHYCWCWTGPRACLEGRTPTAANKRRKLRKERGV